MLREGEKRGESFHVRIDDDSFVDSECVPQDHVGIDEGVVVDTHVKRLSTLLGFTKQATPEKIEQDLMGLFPEERWTLLAHLLIFHGRQVCIARRPRCEACVMSHLCPSSRV